MSYKNYFFLLLALGWAVGLSAQSLSTVSGTLRDAANGETLIGASVEAVGLGKGNVSNEYGFYSFSLPESADSITLRFSYLGYETVLRRVVFKGSFRLDVSLRPEGAVLEEVVVRANSLAERVKSTEMSVATIGAKEIKAVPALFGETDVLKILQLKPGFTPGSEGTTGLYVRGGNNDQNLIVLDEAVV
ncbi:MAG TPA: carboxypeptidase-like regulatory domain-containing protein, partial [Saprospiraceae bacterium]|nr:carboxypeptidase-like regulatory domain-containing protein [Saprospiraceae bacterium]